VAQVRVRILQIKNPSILRNKWYLNYNEALSRDRSKKAPKERKLLILHTHEPVRRIWRKSVHFSENLFGT